MFYDETVLERSMIGSTAAACVDRGELDRSNYDQAKIWARNYRRQVRGIGPRPQRLDSPKRRDGIPPGTCTYCGMIGKHQTPADCIAALRDRLALWE